MSLLRSYEIIYDLHPPVETGGYKYVAPTERDAEALMAETELAPFPDPFGRLRACPQLDWGGKLNPPRRKDMGAQQGKLL